MGYEENDILNSFVTEAQEGVADLENDLLEIENAGDLDVDLINKVFRNIHSIKGTAGFCGLTAISELTHEMENVLNLIRSGDIKVNSTIIEPLLHGADALTSMIHNVEESNNVDVAPFVKALRAVVDGGAAAEVKEAVSKDVDIELPNGTIAFLMISEFDLTSRQKQGHHVYVLDLDLIADVQDKGRTPETLLKQLYDHGELIKSYVSTSGIGMLDQPLPEQIGFMVLLTSTKERDDLATALDVDPDRVWHIATPAQCQWGPTGPTEPESAGGEAGGSAAASDAVDLSSLNPTESSDSGSSRGGAAAQASLRVNVSVLDALMTLAGELVLGRNQLLQVLSNGNSQDMESVGAKIDRITSELQEAIMQTRMQPVGTVFNKFPRIVRDLSSKLGKQCDIRIEGKSVELDKSIIEAIGDPLTHLIRNSVDHGVESPEKRAEAGKDAMGTVVLRAFHQAGKVNISISDDGAGIDAKRLKEKAVAKGALTEEEAADLNEREATNLIFHPGFSTAEQVTDVSGRGVGMDVVRTNIEKLGGTIDIETGVGVGTTFTIQLPLTLAIMPSLVVRNEGNQFAIPQPNISELIRVKADEVDQRIQRVQNSEVIRRRGELLPIVRLTDAFSYDLRSESRQAEDLAAAEAIMDEINSTRTDADSTDGQGDTASSLGSRGARALNIVVVESGDFRYGIVVDSLEDSQEIVVKPLGRHMSDSICLAGATILGDGQVAMIIDVAGLAAHTKLRAIDGSRDEQQGDVNRADVETQSVLMFSNAPAEFFAVPTSMIARIERTKTEEIKRVGDVDCIQYRGSTLPVISLEKHINAEERADVEHIHVVVIELGDREIGLVAPQLHDIRAVTTDIDSKTLVETGVLGSLVLDERTIRFVDVVGLVRAVHPSWFAPKHMNRRKSDRNITILLAEDSNFFRGQVASFLESEGYVVIGAEDGEEAWEKLHDPDSTFNLVITDIEMPKVDGLELTRRIRKDPVTAHLPIIALSSLASEEDVRRGSEAGVNEYQVKMDRDELLRVVRRILKEYRDRAGGDVTAAGAGQSLARSEA